MIFRRKYVHAVFEGEFVFDGGLGFEISVIFNEVVVEVRDGFGRFN
jgi:hypothetical protein